VGKMLRLNKMEPRVKPTLLDVIELGNVQTLAPQQASKQWVHPPGQQSSFTEASFASDTSRSVHAASSLQQSSVTGLVATPMLAPIGSENNANAKTRRRWMALFATDIRPFSWPNEICTMDANAWRPRQQEGCSSRQARIVPSDRPAAIDPFNAPVRALSGGSRPA